MCQLDQFPGYQVEIGCQSLLVSPLSAGAADGRQAISTATAAGCSERLSVRESASEVISVLHRDIDVSSAECCLPQAVTDQQDSDIPAGAFQRVIAREPCSHPRTLTGGSELEQTPRRGSKTQPASGPQAAMGEKATSPSPGAVSAASMARRGRSCTWAHLRQDSHGSRHPTRDGFRIWAVVIPS